MGSRGTHLSVLRSRGQKTVTMTVTAPTPDPHIQTGAGEVLSLSPPLPQSQGWGHERESEGVARAWRGEACLRAKIRWESGQHEGLRQGPTSLLRSQIGKGTDPQPCPEPPHLVGPVPMR